MVVRRTCVYNALIFCKYTIFDLRLVLSAELVFYINIRFVNTVHLLLLKKIGLLKINGIKIIIKLKLFILFLFLYIRVVNIAV